MSDASYTDTAALSWLAADGDVDATESVGSALRRERERHGLTLADVSQDLCLKEDVLRALESRQYSALPKAPYCFGFVRTYARYLGLDGEEMVQRLKDEIGDVPPAAKLVPPPQPLRGSRFPARAILTLSVVVAAAVYGGWYFYMDRPASIVVPATSADALAPMAPVPLLADEEARRINAQVDAAAKAAEKAAAAAEEERANATTSGGVKAEDEAGGEKAAVDKAAVEESPTEKRAVERPMIVLKTSAACWVYIHDQNGRVVFHKVMGRGEQFTVPDHKGDLVMDLGNPSAMQIVFNGRVLKPLTAQGLTRRISLDPAELAKLP